LFFQISTFEMKVLSANVFLVFTATLALAAPTENQVPLANTNHGAPPAAGFRTSFVVKGLSPPASVTIPHEDSPPASDAEQSADKKTAWDLFWSSLQRQKGAPESCFCAGGSVCCHTVHGLNCNYGVCGI
jgi:hypothetical protein